MSETATATNPNNASASTDAPVNLLATAGEGTGETTQTPPVQDPADKAAETPASETPTPEATPKPGAPEKYEFTAPEGTEYDSEILGAFTDAAREANLTQEAAQKLIEKMAPAITARQADQVQAIHKEWLEASTADQEFGGEKLKENLGIAKKALDMFDPVKPGLDENGKPFTSPLRTLLDETGLGNHPEVLRLLFRAGKAISEDGIVVGSPRGSDGADPIAALYPTMTKA